MHLDVVWAVFVRGVKEESVHSRIPAVAKRRAQSFSFTMVCSFYGVICLRGSDVTHANLALINQCSSDTSYTGAARPENIHTVYVFLWLCMRVCVRKNDILRTRKKRSKSRTHLSCSRFNPRFDFRSYTKVRAGKSQLSKMKSLYQLT